jgi:hypothetical protein
LNRQLLADDLEEECVEEVLLRKLSEPRTRLEVRSFVYEPGEDRIGAAEMGKCAHASTPGGG